MQKLMVFALLAAVVLVLAGPCLAVKTVETAPAGESQDASSAGPTIEDVHVLAKWAVVLSALALVSVLWVGWSLKSLARNQIQLGKLIQTKLPPKGD